MFNDLTDQEIESALHEAGRYADELPDSLDALIPDPPPSQFSPLYLFTRSMADSVLRADGARLILA